MVRTKGLGIKSFVLRHKALTALGLVALLLLGAVGGWAWSLNHKLDGIPRFEAGDQAHDSSVERVPGDAVNILLVGVDNGQTPGSLAEQVSGGEWQPGSFRSDTMIVLHISADRESAQVVSLPRDSWVDIDDEWGAAKLNAAFSYGGPALLSKTVEKTTGMHLDHIAVVDLEGFEDITDTLGGVTVHIPKTVADGYRDQTWTAGDHTLDGEEALRYVRQRAGLPRGDLDRVQRQQNYLRAMLAEIKSRGTLVNPAKVNGLVGDVAGNLAVDDGFGNGDLRSLAWALRGIKQSDISYATAPVLGFDTVEGQSVVRLDLDRTQRMFRAIAEDDYDSWAKDNPVDRLPSPTDVD